MTVILFSLTIAVPYAIAICSEMFLAD